MEQKFIHWVEKEEKLLKFFLYKSTARKVSVFGVILVCISRIMTEYGIE